MTRSRSPFAPKPTGAAPTERQDAFVAAIRTFQAKHARSPSTSDVAALVGVTREGARVQLHALERKGVIADVPKVVRSGKWTVK